MITLLMLIAGIVMGVTEYWVIGKFLTQGVPKYTAILINLSFLGAGIVFIVLGYLDLGIDFTRYVGIPVVVFGIVSILRVLVTKKEG